LTDAGTASKNRDAVDEGIRIFRAFLAASPSAPTAAYNLANALEGLTRMDPTPAPDWYRSTANLRAEARALLGGAAPLLRKAHRGLASQCLTNLGNALDRAFRWIEALESYFDALGIYPKNAVASGCAAEVLLRVAKTGPLGDPKHLSSIGFRHAWHAQQ